MTTTILTVSFGESLQLKMKPLTNYMEKLQTDINPSMRGILVDWLVEVSLMVAALCRFVNLSTYDEFYLLHFNSNVVEL